jgi:hypothetical protein
VPIETQLSELMRQIVYGRYRNDEPDLSAIAAAADARDRRGRLRALPRSYWLLLAIFVVLQATDIVTTNRALAISGNWEANPIMASYQAQWGTMWWLPKAAAVGWVCLAAPLIRRWWPVIFAVSYSVLTVVGNLAVL